MEGTEERLDEDTPCPNKSEKAQGWIRTIWPIVAAALALWFAMGQREQRLALVEEHQVDTDVKVECLAGDVSELQENMAGVNTKVDMIYTDVQWMRNNWPSEE
jgi:hypothetical protein